MPAAEARFVRLRASIGPDRVVDSETRRALRWLLGLVLLAVTAATGGLAVLVVALAVKHTSPPCLRAVLVQVLSWLFLVTGVALALGLLFERRGTRYLFGAWVAALTLVLASLQGLFGPLRFLAGIVCALAVGLLVAAIDWATSGHAV